MHAMCAQNRFFQLYLFDCPGSKPTLTERQILGLEKEFKRIIHWRNEDKAQIAEDLNLTCLQVHAWFENRLKTSTDPRVFRMAVKIYGKKSSE